MDPVTSPAAPLSPNSCPFCCSPSSSSPWRRSVKRKLDSLAAASAGPAVARVEIDDELAALREAVAAQQETIQDLCTELEEERGAAASAASETMSMILRLQGGKAEVQLEARQFKRFAEERMAHDHEEILALEDLLFKRDLAIESLSSQRQVFRHLLLAHGVPLSDEDIPLEFLEYPALKCAGPADLDHEGSADDQGHVDCLEEQSHPFEEIPPMPECLQELEQRISLLENDSPAGTSTVRDKGVVEQSSTQRTRHSHSRESSQDNRDCVSELFKKTEEEFPTIVESSVQRSSSCSFIKDGEFPVEVDRPCDDAGEEDIDRVYTIDAVHGVETVRVLEECSGTPVGQRKGWEKEAEPDIKKLYMRLEALEADRESMRQTLISMRTEKTQLELLKEIAQQLSKEVTPERKIVKKSFVGTFSVIALLKCVLSLVFWRKQSARSRYTFGLSNSNAGLLLLLDTAPQMSQWRCLRRAPPLVASASQPEKQKLCHTSRF